VHAPHANRPQIDELLPTEPIALPIVDAPRQRSRAVWIQVESGLHVANTAATFVGTVTVTAAGFEARDGAGRHRGTFTSLDAAKGSLEACAEDARAARRARRTSPHRGAVAPVI
jgi:hypothetical protein